MITIRGSQSIDKAALKLANTLEVLPNKPLLLHTCLLVINNNVTLNCYKVKAARNQPCCFIQAAFLLIRKIFIWKRSLSKFRSKKVDQQLKTLLTLDT